MNIYEFITADGCIIRVVASNQVEAAKIIRGEN